MSFTFIFNKYSISYIINIHMINWIKRTSRKFTNAMKGMVVMVKEEKSLWVHLFATLVVIVMGFVFNISTGEWIAVIFAVVLVIGFEILNTAIEYLVDIVSFEYNVKAKKIKDVAAMATLIVTIGAVIIGLLIFGPEFLALFAGEEPITPTPKLANIRLGWI